MDWLTFIAEMTKAISWPVVLLVALVLLRKPFNDVLPLLTKVKYGGVEMEFQREVDQLSQSFATDSPPLSASKEDMQMKEKILQTAIVDPRSAVIQAWRYVENRLIDLAQEHNIDVAPGAWTRPLILSFFMLDKGLVTESQDNTIRQIKALRDQTANTMNMQLSAEEAVSYVNLAMQLAASLKKSGKNGTT